jgi:hypothetical protein
MKPRHVFCLAAGACDTLTGLLLMAAPVLTLRLMRIPGEPADPNLVRFIGAFVFGIGASYLRPFREPDAARREAQFAAMLDLTAWLRFAVGSFVAIAILRGWLVAAWATVAATDLGLAAAQSRMLRKGVFTRGV